MRANGINIHNKKNIKSLYIHIIILHFRLIHIYIYIGGLMGFISKSNLQLMDSLSLFLAKVTAMWIWECVWLLDICNKIDSLCC